VSLNRLVKRRTTSAHSAFIVNLTPNKDLAADTKLEF
jgi:hypothetical protein